MSLVEKVILAPVVSSESNSPESLLARNAKALQAQAETDSKYDTVLSRDGKRISPDPMAIEDFRNSPSQSTLLLLGFAVGLMATISYFKRK